MFTFDFILLCILGAFVFFGLIAGLIHSLGALIGIIGGAYVAGHYYDGLANAFQFLFYGNLNLARISIFIILFVIVSRLVGLIFYLFEKVFNVVSIIPFLSSINRLAGAVLGFFEGVLVISGALYVASKYDLGWFTEQMRASEIAGYFLLAANVITPLLPELLKKLQSLM